MKSRHSDPVIEPSDIENVTSVAGGSPAIVSSSAASIPVWPLSLAFPEGAGSSAGARTLSSLDASLAGYAGLDLAAAHKVSSITLSLLEGARLQASVALNDVNGRAERLSLGSVIAVDIRLDGRLGEAGLERFIALGLIEPVRVGNLVSGQIRLGDIGKIAALDNVGAISYSPHATAAGSVTSGAEGALGTLALNNAGLNGAGVKVGVLSDSYNYLNGASAGIGSGNLPVAGVQVLQDAGTANNPTSDEGRAMLEIVHDIAPGSGLMFATAWNGMAGFAQNIRGLANAGASVIVDDIAYFRQLTFTDDVIRRAINDVADQGKIYLTANGNDDVQGIIESNLVFRNANQEVLGAREFLDFDPSTTDAVETLSFTAQSSGTVYLRMTWSSPAPSVHQKLSTADLDVFVTNSAGAMVGFSADDQSQMAFDPVELLALNVVAGERYDVWVEKYSGSAPQYLQINAPLGHVSFNQPALFDEYGSVYGNGLAAGAISVGAVYYEDSPKLGGAADVEDFSSYGKAYLTHDRSGNPITPVVSYGAEIAGVDGLNTTFFGFDWDSDGHPNFFGTSAAAPSVAAVVALMLQKNPTLTRKQVLDILQATAYNAVSYADESAVDPVSGAGLVNASAALAAVPDMLAVTQFSPADGATSVATYANIALSFSDVIQRGGGAIRIVANSPTGSVRESFDVATSTRLQFNGNTLTIDPTLNLAGKTRYYVTFDAGSVTDLSGNSYAGTTSYDFQTADADTSAPKVSSYSPADGSTGLATHANIALTFNEAIQRGTGTITLRAGSATGAVVESFDTASSDRLSITNRTLTVDPTANLSGRTKYFLTFAAGTVKDLSGNNFAGTTSYDFTTAAADLTAPAVAQFSPADGATGVATYANIALTFSEAIRKGTGTIELRAGSAAGELVESFDIATSSRVTVSGKVLTIDPVAALDGNSAYVLLLPGGAVQDLVGNAHAGTSTYDFTTGEADESAPEVAGLTPADGATAAPPAASIRVTFNEAIQRGTGDIVIRAGSAEGAVVETFDASDSNRLSISGSTLTIDPTDTLASQTQYFVSFNAGSIEDLSGNDYAGTSSYSFTTGLLDLTAPTVTQFSPVDGASNVPTYANIALNFSEEIQRGTGKIRIVTNSPTGSVRESFDAATSTRLHFNGNQLTIDPTANLAGDTRYYVSFDVGSLTDLSENGYAGTTSYDFQTAETDTSAPKVSSYSPADGSTGAPTHANIALTFNEAIQRGAGTIQLRAGSATGTVVESFDAASSDRLSITNRTLTVDPTANLSGRTKYFLTFAAGTVKDLSGNNFAGTTSYDFTTAAIDLTAPTVAQFSPADGATGVATDATIALTFSESIRKGTGTIELHEGSASGALVESFDIATSSRVTVSGKQLAINPTADLEANTSYVIILPGGVVEDLAGNVYAGTSAYDFTTTASSFDIDVEFSGLAQYQTYFDQAAARFEAMLTGDLPDVTLNGRVIDDLLINASVVTIDGSGGILGQAGFTGYRDESLLPYEGIMQFDAADVAGMVSAGIFADVVAHEMAHVLGFGILWDADFLGLNSTFGQYTGQEAMAEYRLLRGQPSATYVPLETGGGSGTANSHWSEAVFGSELMTGYASPSGNMPLSRMTVASFADMGYQVDYSAAEAYSLPSIVSVLSSAYLAGDLEISGVSANDRYMYVGGGQKNDRLSGSDRNDYLAGLQGRDIITTGAGYDKILLSLPASAAGVDRITDFTPGTDTLVFDAAAFGTLASAVGASGIGEGNFVLSDRAQDADDYLLYDTVSQTLFYDADGSGAAAARAVAVIGLAGGGTLSCLDLMVA